MSFKPMLASPADLDNLRFPLVASPKLDGIRAAVVNGKLLSRSLKSIPNAYIRMLLECRRYEGLDGELIVGEATAKDVYLQSVSGVMRKEGQPNFTFHVFDRWDNPATPFWRRFEELRQRDWSIQERAALLSYSLVNSLAELHMVEEGFINDGFEGVILRDPEGTYKYGRSSAREGLLLKVKRFADSEAEILSVEEEMFNGNEAETNELGRTKRSTAKAGLVGKGTMGALRVRDIHRGWEFCIGTGFTADQRAQPWKIGTVHKYKYFPIGMKDVPRHPVYIGPRSKLDL